ncbi:MAG: LacI family DNA-binding transcriptional regulator [Planctomycetota bacterium]
MSTVSIKDVAEAAKVSLPTAYAALNQTGRVATQTRERIQSLAKSMGYSPSYRAKALASGKSFAVGLLHAGDSSFSGKLFDQMIQGFSYDLTNAGYHLVHLPVHQDRAALKQSVSEQRVDGYLVMQPTPPKLDELLGKLNGPAVLVNLTSQHPASAVLIDEAYSVELIADHLAELGYDSAFYVTLSRETVFDSHSHYSVAERHAAMLGRFGDNLTVLNGEILDEGQRGSETGMDQVAAQIKADLGRPGSPRVVVVYNDHMAMCLLQALSREKVRVPQDLGMVVFDDTFGYYATPPLTCVAQPALEVGQKAAEILMQQIQRSGGSSPVAMPEVRLRSQLIVRDSLLPADLTGPTKG